MFKAVKGFEGFYEVDELGRVRSVDRIVELQNGGTRKFKGRELKPAKDSGGYAMVNLSKNGITKMMKVHRMVAEAFVPNPENLPEIHHINHVRNDNRTENLRWVTRAEQMDEHLRAAKGTKLRVVGHDIDKMFISSHEVERELGVNHSDALKVAKGIYKQAKGYRIFFADQNA